MREAHQWTLVSRPCAPRTGFLSLFHSLLAMPLGLKGSRLLGRGLWAWGSVLGVAFLLDWQRTHWPCQVRRTCALGLPSTVFTFQGTPVFVPGF